MNIQNHKTAFIVAMLFIPLFSLFVAISLGRPANARLPKRTILLVALFLSLILSLFLQLVTYGRQRDSWIRFMHLSVFGFLLIILSVLATAFSQISEGLEYKEWLPLPMWLFWCIILVADCLMIWDIAGLCRLRRQELGRDSIKQALDMLPSGICYFTPSGRVKLCNRQMDSLFHTIAQSNLQTLAELQDAP